MFWTRTSEAPAWLPTSMTYDDAGGTGDSHDKRTALSSTVASSDEGSVGRLTREDRDAVQRRRGEALDARHDDVGGGDEYAHHRFALLGRI